MTDKLIDQKLEKVTVFVARENIITANVITVAALICCYFLAKLTPLLYSGVSDLKQPATPRSRTPLPHTQTLTHTPLTHP